MRTNPSQTEARPSFRWQVPSADQVDGSLGLLLRCCNQREGPSGGKADSLYWMSRYFERADHCARVFEANYNLMLNPSKLSTEERWHRIMASLGIAATSSGIDPQKAMIKLTSDPDDESSIVFCIAESRENAGQVREQISSEMWECLNSLYHQVTQANALLETDSDPLRLVAPVREGAYQFYGITDATMNHGEGWQYGQSFIAPFFTTTSAHISGSLMVRRSAPRSERWTMRDGRLDLARRATR